MTKEITKATVEESAKSVLARVQAGEKVEVEVELFPGVKATAQPFVDVDGNLALKLNMEGSKYGAFSGTLKSHDRAGAERMIEDAVKKGVFIRAALWLRGHGRNPRLKRTFSGPVARMLGVGGTKK